MTKRSRKKKTIPHRTGHFNSLNKVDLRQAEELARKKNQKRQNMPFVI